MTAFLTVLLVLFILGLCGTTHNLQGDYPRQSTAKRRDDLIAMAIQVCMIVWAITLLVALP